ncbi:hypothetical protein MMC20_004311 [Loxospora ochrophaea]|nr:hypothetical protein [Loxospora ochrophaea]
MATVESMAHFNFMPDVSQIVIVNVKYFDGEHMIYTPHNIYIAQGKITIIEPYDPAAVFDESWFPTYGNGSFLVPGFIDSHVHLLGIEQFRQLCSYGVTSAMDMATFPLALLQSLRQIAGRNGLPDARFCGLGASTRSSNWAVGAQVQNPTDARAFIQTQVAQGADYCKVVMDDSLPEGMVPFDMETLRALIDTAHENGKKMIAHACTLKPYQDAIAAGMDIITHSPMNTALDPTTDITPMVKGKTIAIPTLCMQQSIIQRNPHMAQEAHWSFDTVTASARAMHQAGIPILVGTDSNAAEVSPGHPMHGVSLHLEMELLVHGAGMSPIEVLRAATSKPASVFGLNDRGSIQVGKRADLVLLAREDPTMNISATRMIRQVWAQGVPFLPLRGLIVPPTVAWGYFMQENDVTPDPADAKKGKALVSCCP